jgi:Glycosyltransferase family 87
MAKLYRMAPLRLYGTAALVFGLVAGVAFYLRAHSEWEKTYLFGAQRLRAGIPLYGPGTHGFNYPPLIALLLVPVSRWPRAVARIGWYAVNLAALLAMIRTGWRLAGGPEFGAPRWSARQHLSFVLRDRGAIHAQLPQSSADRPGYRRTGACGLRRDRC